MEEDKAKAKFWIFEFDERRAKIARANRDLYKWVLDFLRNLMVVAALAYLAVKSGSYFVWGIAIVANLALCGYCYTYLDVWTAREDFFWHKGRKGKLVALAAIVLIQLMMLVISAMMYLALNKIVSVQQA